MCGLSNFYGAVFSYTFKPFAEDGTYHKPINDQFMSIAAAVGSGLVNGLSRIFMGLLIDKFTFKTLFSILMIISVVNSLSCFWAGKFAPAFFVCVLLNYFVIAGIFTILPVATIKVFGNKYGPYIYVFVMLGALVADWCNLALI